VSRDGSKRAAAQARKSTLFILQQLVTKDFKLKYRRSVLGVLWSVLNPLLMMAVLTVVFSNMFRFDIAYYPFYLILGMTLFTLMNDATTTAMTSIIDSAGLLKKVRVAKAVFPVEKVLFSLVNYVFAFVAVLVVMLVLRVPLSPTMFAWPLLVLYVVVFCVGLGLILSSLAVFFRDVIHLWSVVTMAWNYLTPIFWPEEYLTSLQGGLGTLLLTIEQFNPMYYYVSYLRQIMMYQTMPDLGFNLICIAFALVTLAVGVLVFRKTQSKFILYI
jgi:ABC-2 type transport system permease protein